MKTVYDEQTKALPPEQLRALFMAVGWSDGGESDFLRAHFADPFVNSTLVVSAWQGERLIGCVRVLSDRIVRSVIYDLAVHPEYQRNGVGSELLRRCMGHFKGCEWLVGTDAAACFYIKNGFSLERGVFLSRPSSWF